MAMTNVQAPVGTGSTPSSYKAALAMVTTLFFMWGFLTCLNDILVPHLKPIFDLSYAKIMFIQFAFFSAYFVFSVPLGRLVERIGYKQAMNEIGNTDKQEVGRWINNRAENSHQPFRRRERAMLRFRRMKTLQKFSSVHAVFHNLFNQDRHLISRDRYKAQRSAALAEWKALTA